MTPVVVIGTIYNDSLGGYGIGLGFFLGAVLAVGFNKWFLKRKRASVLDLEKEITKTIADR